MVMESVPEDWQKLRQRVAAWHGSERPRHWALRPSDFHAETGKVVRSNSGLEGDLRNWEAD